MLNYQHRQPQLPVEPVHCGNEIRCCNGIQLGGRLVQNQHFGLHYHYCRQIQKLLLAAAELAHRSLVPALNAEICCGFRDPASHFLLGKAHVFQPEGQFMPYLVRDDLLIRALHHISDGKGGYILRQRGYRHAVQQYLTGQLTHGGQLPLDQPQQGGLAAARCAAYADQFARLHRKGDILDGCGFCACIGKAYLSEFHHRHAIASFA